MLHSLLESKTTVPEWWHTQALGWARRLKNHPGQKASLKMQGEAGLSSLRSRSIWNPQAYAPLKPFQMLFRITGCHQLASKAGNAHRGFRQGQRLKSGEGTPVKSAESRFMLSVSLRRFTVKSQLMISSDLTSPDMNSVFRVVPCVWLLSNLFT